MRYLLGGSLSPPSILTDPTRFQSSSMLPYGWEEVCKRGKDECGSGVDYGGGCASKCYGLWISIAAVIIVVNTYIIVRTSRYSNNWGIVMDGVNCDPPRHNRYLPALV